MIPAVVLNAVEPVAAGKSALDGRAGAPRLLPRLEPGQVLSARIEAKLPDGSFKVEVAGQELRMTLPDYVAAGDTLKLTFLTRDPRLTFALQEQPQTASAASLSAAGRLVATMMARPGEPVMIAAASAAVPLLAAPAADATALSFALKQTLAQSGLFYESHQAEWVAGKRDLAQLQTEPQARLTQNAPRAPAVRAGDGAATQAAATDSPLAASAPSSVPLLQIGGSSLVQQQLAALESGRIVVQLEIWPKQWMQWEIEERERQPTGGPDAPASWQTRLRLNLPQLGELHAVLALANNRVQIRLDTANAASATLLQDHRASLRAALAGAGVPAARIAVACHERT